MDLELYITKRYGLKYRSKGIQVKFAVVDKDKSPNYPQNFLCMLPRKIDPNLKIKHKFIDLFGSESPKLAYNLLKEALDNEEDTEVIKDIRSRIKELESIISHDMKCRLCGKTFSNKGNYKRSRICSECKNRIYQENN